MTTLGEKMRDLRRQRHMTQQELADGIVTVAMINQVESERAAPSPEVLVRLSERLGVDPAVFDESIQNTHDAHRLLRAARRAMERRDFAEALASLREIQSYDSGPVRSELVLQYIAECLEGMHEIPQAEGYWDKVVRLKFERNEVPTAARIYYRMGNAYRQDKQYDLARLFWERARAWLEEVVEPPGDLCLRLYGNLGKLYLQTGEPARAHGYYKRAGNADVRMSNLEYATVQHGLGNACLAQEKFSEAQVHFDNARRLYETEGHDRGAIQCRINSAIACQRAEKMQDAVEQLSALIDNASVKPDNLRLANALVSRAQAYASGHERDLAVRDAKQALEAGRDASLQLEALEVLLDCMAATSSSDAAEVAQVLYSTAMEAKAIHACSAALRVLREQAFASGIQSVAMDTAQRVADLAVEVARRPQLYALRFPEK